MGPLGVVLVHESTDCVLELCRRLVLRAPQTLRRITRPEALSNTLLSAQSRASSPVKSSPQELAATLWAARPTEPVAHDRIYGTDRAARCRVFLSANEVAHGNGFDPLHLIASRHQVMLHRSARLPTGRCNQSIDRSHEYCAFSVTPVSHFPYRPSA